MTQLSVNINKFATLRNARGANNPNLIQIVKDCERFGAQGITIHPRPDERHIKKSDVFELKNVISTEFNIEGYPSKAFLELVIKILPNQVTLVPDPPDTLTSNAGWDTIKNDTFLKEIIEQLKSYKIRTSIFVEPKEEIIYGAKETLTDRIEFFTGAYAHNYPQNKNKAIRNYKECALTAKKLGIGINAGHDLDLKNTKFFVDNIPETKEVSIGHAIVCDSIYYGLENTIQLYLRCLKKCTF